MLKIWKQLVNNNYLLMEVTAGKSLLISIQRKIITLGVYIQTPLGSLCLIRPLQSRLVLQEESARRTNTAKITNAFLMIIIVL